MREIANTPFKWGQHDCFTFTNTAFEKMHGKGWADDWLNSYMSNDGYPLKKTSLQSRFGFDTFEEAVDTKLLRYDGIPPRGALVTTKNSCRNWYVGAAMGISIGTKAAFLSDTGTIYLPIETIDNAWVIK